MSYYNDKYKISGVAIISLVLLRYYPKMTSLAIMWACAVWYYNNNTPKLTHSHTTPKLNRALVPPTDREPLSRRPVIKTGNELVYGARSFEAEYASLGDYPASSHIPQGPRHIEETNVME